MYVSIAPLDTYQILEESEYGTIRFHVPYHFQSRVQSATSSAQNAARSRRLAQEVATLSTSLPLSQSSSVFVRCDEERLDVMKVLDGIIVLCLWVLAS
jgi:baculoviral IAP repeat-containing protein 6